eukprot:SAG31_NODE_13471_length_867_cov_0.778646_1_plen_123_part_10
MITVQKARQFLSGLLDRDPSTRFAAKEIKAHVWFKGVDWEKVLRKEYQPPMKPKLTSDMDLRYFETCFTEIPVGNPSDFADGASGSTSGAMLGAARQSVSQGLFEGFTYDPTLATGGGGLGTN